MPGLTIGIKMGCGFPGTYARSGDCIIMNRPVKDGTADIPFGHAVILNDDNTYEKFGATGTMATFAGIAVREVKQTSDYFTAAGAYKANQPADVIERGSVAVVCNVGTPKAGGKVYIRTKANEAIPEGIIGGFEAEADADNTIELTNCRWATGNMDANNVCELTILTRNNP